MREAIRRAMRGRDLPVKALGLAAALFPLVSSNSYYLRLLTSAALYVLLATGLNVPLGQAGLLDMGYVGFFATGAYVRALLASPQLGIHLSFLTTLLAALLAAVALGLAIGIPTLRLKGDYLAIVTMSLAEIIRIVLTNLDRPVNITNGPNGVIRIEPPDVGPFVLGSSRAQYYLMLAFAAAGYWAYSALERSKVGMRWRAVKDDPVAAESFGVDVAFYRVLAFVVGAAYAATAGVLFASWQGAVFPQNFTLNELITLYCMVILGGAGNRNGAVAGACALVLVPELLRSYSVYRMLVYGAALVTLQLVKSRRRAASGRRGRRPQKEGYRKRTVPRASASPGMSEGMSDPAGPVLSVRGVTHSFGGLQALDGVSFDLQKAEVLGIIGPNGSGKTTLVNVISGITKPASGRCFLEGRLITGLRPHAIYRRGLSRTFQNLRLFDNMTVEENVLLGTGGGGFSLPWTALTDKLLEPAGTLAYPERKALEIARALAGSPKVVLLDEPSAGMSQEEAAQLGDTIRDLKRQGVSVVLVEHRMPLVMEVCDRVIVLDRGHKIAEGLPQQVAADPLVAEVYLGKGNVETARRQSPGADYSPPSAERDPERRGRPVLRMHEVEAWYGHIQVLRKVSLEVAPGEVVCLLGGNGAGKTTVLKAIMGSIPAVSGQIEFMGRSLGGKPAPARKGIAISPEGRRVFSRMTVQENLETGAGAAPPCEVKMRLEYVYSVFPRLAERRRQRAGTLSGGEQQMLAIGRALMSKPSLLLLDEPSMGLAPVMADRIFAVIADIAARGVAVLLVEQNAARALSVADRGYVLQSGAVVMEGPARDLSLADLQGTYLGAGRVDRQS